MTDKTELELLKEQADSLGVSYSNNIGIETLRSRVAEAVTLNENSEPSSIAQLEDSIKPVTEQTKQEEVNQEPKKPLTEGQLRVSAAKRKQELRKSQLELVRVIISNMDPTKGDLTGGLYSVSNSLVGTVQKFIPYNVDEKGFHIPRILLNSLKRRRYRVTNEIKDPLTGKTRYVTKHLREFNIIELPPLTQAELDKIKRDNQALAELH